MLPMLTILRGVQMSRVWDQEYNRNDFGVDDELENMPFTGKKKPKKKKLYVIDYMYANNARFMFRSWAVYGRYETEKQAKEAFGQIVKNQNHNQKGMEIKEYKGFSFDKSLANIRIYLNGNPYVYYRLSKKD